MAATTARIYNQSLHHPMQNEFQEQIEQTEYLPVIFCRALYDYQAEDLSSLSFSKGDIIEVLTQLETGWWDGLLHGQRGWFPSNYVIPISEQEAELELRINHEEGEWGQDSQEHIGPTNDFWMPQVTMDGRVSKIFYVNTQTGESANELPSEIDSEVDGVHNGSFSKSNFQTGTSYLHRNENTTAVVPESTTAGFGLPRRTGTPEPWVKRLADDGMSYYYFNTVDSTIRWTPPSPIRTSHQGSFTFPDKRQRTDSSVTTDHISLHSDDSDQNPLWILGRAAAHAHSDSQTLPTPTLEKYTEESPDLQAAKDLQTALQERFPPIPDSLDDLAQAARAAVTDLLDAALARSNNALVKDAIKRTTDSVRNLIYASSTLIGPLSSLPSPYTSLSGYPDTNDVKPFYRKVTAAMVKLTAGIRSSFSNDVINNDLQSRFENDASELERAIATFVGEVLRRRPNGGSARHVRAVLSSEDGKAGIGLELLGAGSAGSWRGFGFIEPIAGHALTREIATAVNEHKADVERPLLQLQNAVSAGQLSEAVELGSQGIQCLITFLGFVTYINLARSLDFDSDSKDTTYSHFVLRAKELVRNLEFSLQAAFEDGATLLSVMQTAMVKRFTSNESRHWSFLTSITPSLCKNLDDACAYIAELVDIAIAQAERCTAGGIDGKIGYRDPSRFASNGETYTDDDTINDDDYDTGPKSPDDREDVRLEVALTVPRGSRFGDLKNSDSESNISHSNTLALSESLPDHLRATTPSPQPTLGEDEESEKILKKKKKIKEILGPGAPVVIVEEKPWYLQPDHGPKDLWLTPEGAVRGGTLSALIERLTPHDIFISDHSFNPTFLITFKSFTTVEELFQRLVTRFYIQAPLDLTPKEFKTWTEKKQQIIRLRVMNIFKQMITDADVLEREDMFILDRIKEFAVTVVKDAEQPTSAAQQLVNLVERTQNGSDPILKMPQVTTNQPPAPILPKSNRQLKLLDIDPLELARQLTIMESKLFAKIRPMECLNRGRDVRPSDTDDNISALIEASNKVAIWVSYAVLSKEDSRKRAAIIKQFIAVADRCRLLQNFSTMAALVAGLNSPPIRRLKRTWQQVSRQSKGTLTEAERTMDTNKNFTNYRTILKSARLPCVPFFGVYLSVLTFIQDGNKNMIQGEIINFSKREKFAEVIREIKHYQSSPYNLTVVPAIQTFIDENLSALQSGPENDDRTWNLSLEREPREREDEKMARLLQESGFL
ncbi:hypothetical protein Clacol_009898 [Clathrus columnatus]|uniref:Ras GEF n=1 Tax=Clathrus columnatus TaxID=1419009 RepID=A0AAV5ASA1_9AGAM|nr:hypothetical protein Clacol_009898 [Clathrus columnatus]